MKVKQPGAGELKSAPFPITISNTPGTPTIISNNDPGGTPVSTVKSSDTIVVRAFGTDTLGTQVRFQQASGLDVTVNSTLSFSSPGNPLSGIGAEVQVPGTANTDDMFISVRTFANGAFGSYSPSVTVTVSP